MSTRQTHFLSEILHGQAISEGTQAYLEARAKDRFYDFVVRKFLEREKQGFTRAELARRIGRRPEMVTRWLGAPGNWTLGTVAVLLAAICAEELEPHSSPFGGRSARNFSENDWVPISSVKNKSTLSLDKKPDKQETTALLPKVEARWVSV